MNIQPPHVLWGGTAGLLDGGGTGREEIGDLAFLYFADVEVCGMC